MSYSLKGLDSPYLIYGLRDPRTNLIRYIGKSSSGLNRPNNHRKPSFYTNCNTRLANWCKNMAAAGTMYEIVVLQYCTSNREELNEAERSWIRLFKQEGYDITNLTVGGDGVAGRVYSAEARARLSEQRRGRKMSEEARRNMSAAQTKRHQERPVTAETLEKMSRSHLGYKHTEESKAKMSKTHLENPPEFTEEERAAIAAKISAAHKGKVVSEATREKLRLTSTGQVVSEETREKQSKVRKGRACPWVSEARLGSKHSDETKAKMSRTKALTKALRNLALMLEIIGQTANPQVTCP
jgi:hypothetical protein